MSNPPTIYGSQGKHRPAAEPPQSLPPQHPHGHPPMNDDITSLMQDIFLALRNFPEARQALAAAMDKRLAARTASGTCKHCGQPSPPQQEST